MITYVLWDIESQELDRRPQGPKARVAFYLIRGTLYIPQYTSYHCLSVLENGCNHEGILAFTIILEFFSPVYKRIYFIESLVSSIEFISELYIDSTVLDKRKQKILQSTLLYI